MKKTSYPTVDRVGSTWCWDRFVDSDFFGVIYCNENRDISPLRIELMNVISLEMCRASPGPGTTTGRKTKFTGTKKKYFTGFKNRLYWHQWKVCHAVPWIWRCSIVNWDSFEMESFVLYKSIYYFHCNILQCRNKDT